MKVKQLLSIKKNIEKPFIFENETLLDALIQMKAFDAGLLLVRDSNKTITGIFSFREYYDNNLVTLESLSQKKVSQCMNNNIVSILPNAELYECMELMSFHRKKSLPVLEDNSFYGFINVLDVANCLLENHQELIDQLNKYICSSQYVPKPERISKLKSAI